MIKFDKSREGYEVIKKKQYDTLKTIPFAFYDNNIPINLSEYTIRLECLKADNTIVIQENNIVIKNVNEGEVLLNPQITIVSGEVKCQFVLIKNGLQDTTFTFFINVNSTIVKGGIASDSVITILDTLIDKIDEARVVNTNLDISINNGDTAKMRADIDVNSSQLADMAKIIGVNRQYLLNRLSFLNSINGKVCYVGDSITANGWFTPLETVYPNITQVNKGIGGNTTLDIINRIADIKAVAPNQYIVCVGVNDSRYNDTRGAITVEAYIANMATIINNLSTVASVVVIGIWRTYWTDQSAALGPYKNALRVNEWNKALERWCKENQVNFINPNEMLDKIVDFENISIILKLGDNGEPDGIHPNDLIGNQICADSVLYGNKNREDYFPIPTVQGKYFYRLEINSSKGADGYIMLKALIANNSNSSILKSYINTNNNSYKDIASVCNATSVNGVANKQNELPLVIHFSLSERLTTLSYTEIYESRRIKEFKLYETQDKNLFYKNSNIGWDKIEESKDNSDYTTLFPLKDKLFYLSIGATVEQTVIAGDWKKITFDNIKVQKNIVITANQITIPLDGVYNLSVAVPVGLAVGSRLGFSIYKNEGLLRWIYDNKYVSNSDMFATINTSLYLLKGDIIDLRIYHTSTNGASIDCADSKFNLIISKL